MRRISLSALVYLGLISTLFFPSSLSAQDEVNDEISLTEQHAIDAERVIQEIWNEPNSDSRMTVGAELYAPSFDLHSPNDEKVMGCPRSTFINMITSFYVKIPDMELVIESIVANNDMAVVHYTLSGTPDDRFGSSIVLPEGTAIFLPDEPVAWEGVFLYRFEDGLIIEEWWYWDNPFAE